MPTGSGEVGRRERQRGAAPEQLVLGNRLQRRLCNRCSCACPCRALRSVQEAVPKAKVDFFQCDLASLK